jgi:drug/metabolite transporter (DMT)-like permease
MNMMNFARNNFKKLFWGVVAWVVLYSTAFIVGALRAPDLLQNSLVFFIGFIVALLPALMVLLLVGLAMIQMFKRQRSVWGTLGYLVIALISSFYFCIVFLFAAFAAFGFS